MTDGTCDLSHAVALERDIPVIPFKVSVGNEDFRPYNGDPGLKNTFSIGEFYARMRAQDWVSVITFVGYTNTSLGSLKPMWPLWPMPSSCRSMPPAASTAASYAFASAS